MAREVPFGCCTSVSMVSLIQRSPEGPNPVPDVEEQSSYTWNSFFVFEPVLGAFDGSKAGQLLSSQFTSSSWTYSQASTELLRPLTLGLNE